MEALPMTLAAHSFLLEFGGKHYNTPDPDETVYLKQTLLGLERYVHTKFFHVPEVFDQGGHTFILMGETGCGKSTKVPQIIYQYMLKRFPKNKNKIRIAVTEPRRLAAVTLAARVKEEMKSEDGEVAHSVRFDNTFDPIKTKILFLTEGLLVQKIMTDPLLRDYQVVIVDEAHERSINTDLLLAHLRKLVYYRNLYLKEEIYKLKLIIMTATGEASSFKEFFPGSKVIYIEGRVHPVNVNFLVPIVNTDYLSITTALVVKLHMELPIDEHFLVFLTGQEEIDGVVKQLKVTDCHFPCLACPLYAALSKKAQEMAFEIPIHGTRKIVVATNIAETSLTIPGIKVVIDSGFVKSKCYLSSHGVEAYQIHRISKSQATQRAGRAGRESPGKVFRLYSINEMAGFRDFEEPEISRSNLSHLILKMQMLIALDKSPLKLMTDLKEDLAEDAKRELIAIEFVNGTVLSSAAEIMSRFPLQPRLSAVLLASIKRRILEPVCAVLSLVEAENLFLPQKETSDTPTFQEFWAPEGDLITYLNISRQFKKSNNSKIWCEKNRLSHRALTYAAKVCRQLISLVEETFTKNANISSSSSINEGIVQCFGEVIYWQRAHLDKTGKFYIVESIMKKKKSSKNSALERVKENQRPPSQVMHAKIHPSSSLASVRPPEIFYLDITLNEKNDLFLHHCSVYEKIWDKKMK